MLLSLLLSVTGQAMVPPSAAVARPKQYDIRDFFQTPQRSQFRLSDDGNMLGFMESVSVDGQAARNNIHVQALDGSTPVGAIKRLSGVTDRDLAAFFWKGNDTIVYGKDVGGDENFHVVAVNVHSGDTRDLTPMSGVRAGLQDDLPDDPDHILVSHNGRNPEVFDVYKINVHTGDSTLVAENPGNITGWSTDLEGKVRFAITSDGLDSELLYRVDESQPFSSLIKTDFRTTVSPLFFHVDNQRFYALSNRDRDTLSLVLIDPEQPESEELIFSVDGYDVDSASFSRLRKILTAAYYETDKPQHVYFDQDDQARHEWLKAQLPGYELSLQNATRDEQKFIVAAYSDKTPGVRYIYDAQANTLHKLAEINPALSEQDMAPVRSIQYPSRDGLTIHGYLTLPVGQEAKNLPVIVNPHGGPWARDSWGFNPEAQFLANRGYAVLQMNFRGSTGYGRKFWEASFGQWGLSMQDDITDGVQWLIEQGIADPKRIGIYGASYGGYAVLAGITKTPDLYAAAVDYVGVSNLLSFMGTIPPYWKPLLTKMYAMVGDPVKDIDKLTANSPALHADKIITPLFVAQGAQDPRVNIAESDQIVEALRKRSIDVEYMVKDNEGHGFANEENKFEFYERMEAFLNTHLQP